MFEYFISFRYLTARRKGLFAFITTLISIAGVALGVAALIVTLSVMNGFKEDIQMKILGTQSHLVVLPSGQKALERSPEIIRQIHLTQGVDQVAPFIFGQVIVRYGQKSIGSVVKGIIPEDEKKITSITSYVEQGSIDDLTEESAEVSIESKDIPLPGIILGREVARTIGARVGSEIVIISPESYVTPYGRFPRSKIFKVAGLFHSGMYEFDAHLVYMHMSSAQNLFNLEELVSGYGVKLFNLYDAEQIAEDLQQRLGLGFWIRSWIEMNRNLFSALKLEKTVMFIILTLIILVAAFNIISNLFLLTMEKSRDIGILRAIGSTNSSILKIFLFEGMSTGIVGIFSGCGLGLGLSMLLDKYRFIKLPADVYYIDTLPVRIFWGDVTIVCISALIIALTATLIPAIKASRINPVEAIRCG
ncbi:MAG: lipoprotein-releasing ABC transporter permease subunit [bacterium]